MIKINELQKQIEKNQKSIKFTHVANVIMSFGFMALGIVACITLGASPVVTGLSKTFVRFGFPILGMTATVMSNSWAIEKSIKLKNENESLKLEIEKENLKQKIQQLEEEQKLQKELKKDLNANETMIQTNNIVQNTTLCKEELEK